MRHGAKRPECSRRAQQSVSAAAHDEAVDEAARENASRGAITASPFNPVGLTSTTASQVVCHARSDGQPRGRSERSAYDRYDVENCCNQSGGTQD